MSFSSDKPLQTNQLPLSIDFPKEQDQFLETMSLTYKRIVDAVNTKEGAHYLLQEQATFANYFPTSTSSTSSTSLNMRPSYRMVVDFGSLPNAGTKSVAHGISFDANFVLTRTYAAATDPGNQYIPIPYASPVLADNIEMWIDNTNINIKTGKDRTNFTKCIVVIEYLKIS